MTEEILKVHIRKDKIKYLIIPKKSKIKENDYVVISDNMNMINKIKREEKNGRKEERTKTI